MGDSGVLRRISGFQRASWKEFDAHIKHLFVFNLEIVNPISLFSCCNLQ